MNATRTHTYNIDTQAIRCAKGYMYGYNGKEKINEVTGLNGSHLDFGARIYDSRLGRWLSVDPLFSQTPGESSYVFVGNNPVAYIDPDGQFKLSADDKDKYKHLNNLLQKIDAKKTEPKLVAAFSKNSGLSTQRTTEYLTEGDGPLLNIESTNTPGAEGETQPTADKSTTRIVINKRWVTKLENLGSKLDKLKDDPSASKKKTERVEKRFKKQEKFVENIILHEGVHAGDYESNGTFTDEYSEKKAKTESKQGFASPNRERGKDFDVDNDK
ncbi:MAG: RHS repeat-associated core domain-containing protein [Bacteroidetes bacterium]|nr:RHS repeat-associated core domain-containing protein [Bacteroidota bacterium]